MENFLKILTKPDNIPIAVMLVIVIALTIWVLRDALRNDRLIAEGKFDEVKRLMDE